MASTQTITSTNNLIKEWTDGNWASSDWSADDIYESRYRLSSSQAVAYKFTLPESVISISRVDFKFVLEPSSTPITSRNLEVALFDADPTFDSQLNPIQKKTDTTVYNQTTNAETDFDQISITRNQAYIVVSETTRPYNAYYRITHATATITALVASAPSVTALAPKNQTMQGNSTIRFSWSFSGDGNMSESALDWSPDNSTWNTLDYAVSNTYKDIDAMTFPRGVVYWRVRVKSSYDLWSSYAYANFTAVYTAQSQIIPVNSQTSGFVPAGTDLTFSAAMEASGPIKPPFSISAASFYWRSGSAGDYNQVAMTVSADGLTASTTITAGVFPEGTIQWYISGTDDTGRTTETELYTITVLYADVVATAISPSGTVKNTANEITFAWNFQSLNGSTQDGAELEYSVNGTIWLTLGSVDDDSTRYTAAAGTLPGGTLWWRVKAFSTGGDESPWSNPVSFVALGAPVVLAVTGDGKPFLAIAWQTSGQVAYQINIDGTVYGPYYGPDVRHYTAQLPLASGLHTIAVAAQNQQGLWSAWAASDVSVAASSEPEFTLTAESGESISLSWTGDPAFYDVFRDDKKIARTTLTTYTDRAVLGEHVYKIVQVLAGGQYAQSNTATATASVNCPMIGLLSGGDFLRLSLSEDQNRTQSITRSAQVVYTYLSGGRFPVAEIGETEDLTVTGDVSWMHEDADRAAAFEAMLKKPVIYKTPGGVCVVGVLQGFERNDPLWWKTYRFSVRRMEWEDYINATGGA